ncbi:MAG: hypothetical protein QXM93_04510, partial [Candidatus Methanomethyliaceae archaeon]
VVTISRTCTIGSAMVFITILFSGIVSLFVSIAVNVLIDAIRRRVARREKYLEVNLALLREVKTNWRALAKMEQLEKTVLERVLESDILTPKLRKACEQLADLVVEYNTNHEERANLCVPLKKLLLDVYSDLKNPTRIGIIYSSRYQQATEGECGHWGIATPQFFREHFKNYAWLYITPSAFARIRECDIVINPYGEAWVLEDISDRSILESCNILQEFWKQGGIWVHTGGYPFHFACDPSGRKQKLLGPRKRQLGLSFESVSSSSEELPNVSEEVTLLIGEVGFTSVAGYRVCSDANEVWVRVGNKALVGFKKIGNGGLLFQGALCYEAAEIRQFIIALIHLCALEKL